MTNNKLPEILFISHEACRGGATIFLLNVQRWLLEYTDISFTTIMRQSGEMLSEFRELGPVICVSPPAQGYKEKIKRLITKWNPFNDDKSIELSELKSHVLENCKPILIYSNTIVNGQILEALKDIGVPVLTHVHEMEYLIQRFGDINFAKVLLYTDRYIAVSKAVQENLVERHDIPAEKVDLIYGFVPTTRHPSKATDDLKQMIAAELNIPISSYIVGCCGVATWLKGSDLLAQVAYAMPSSYQGQPIHFVWVGLLWPEERYKLYHDAERLGVSERVHFIGVRKNPLDYIAIFDIFALLSREDSFPLVIMEAAALKVPTVCFEKAGGTAEFIAHDAGIVVHYLDCNAFANACQELLSNPSKRTIMANKAMERVRLHHDIDVIVPQILECVSRMSGSSFQYSCQAFEESVSELNLK